MISLLSMSAFAPFMHNNAIGPKCAESPSIARGLFSEAVVCYTALSTRYTTLRLRERWHPVSSEEDSCSPSRRGVEELLDPDTRLPEFTLVDQAHAIINGPKNVQIDQGFEEPNNCAHCSIGVRQPSPRGEERGGPGLLSQSGCCRRCRSRYTSSRGSAGGRPSRRHAPGDPRPN